MRTLAAFALLAFTILAAHAGELVVADIGPMTGPLAGNGIANYIGAKACFDELNATGGINGNKIRFIREDDEYNPDKTLKLLKDVGASEKPVAFINLLGSKNVAAMLKDQTLEHLRIPAIGVTPGADALRSPGSPWVFHVQAGDNAQLDRLTTHLVTIGLTRLAVVYQDNPFGRDGLARVTESARALKATVATSAIAPAGAEDLRPQAMALKKSGAQVYVMILAPNSGASFVRDVRASGDKTSIYGMSYIPAKAIVQKAGEAGAVGIGLTQITPNASSFSSGLAREFHAAMDKHAPPGTDHSQLHLVGYMTARVLVEGLRKAGNGVTPEKLAVALRSLRTDLGGYTIDFTGGNVGSRFVDIGLVTRDARLLY